MRLPFLALALAVVAPLPAQDKFATIPVGQKAFVDRGEISGAVALLADKDRVLHLSAVGVSDLATRRTLRTDDIFWIASMTKPIAAVALGLLVDEARLTFDDPVEKFLPEFRNQWVIQESTATAAAS